jgi:histidyl-tRNA synthetase
MASSDKQNRPKARLAKGFRDVDANEIRGLKRMLRVIEGVYESYGFEPVEQPFIEYTEALGKFLPDQDRPNEGVFSFQDDDEQWLSLRYDLTAPLARYVAENQQSLPTPFRSYRQGWVFRNEKPGPGRYRQFMQFDADTVGSASPAADAEVCMMAADTMKALGIPRQSYVINVNSRKVLDDAMDAAQIDRSKRLNTLRALDKFDRLGEQGVVALLGINGRKDESGDHTQGAGLNIEQIDFLMSLFFLTSARFSPGVPEEKLTVSEKADQPRGWGKAGDFGTSNIQTCLQMIEVAEDEGMASDGLKELLEISRIVDASGYGPGRIRISPSVIRGLEYYTGPVFECELLMETKDENGKPVRFGSVGGGGRYDDLVARFTGQKVPATGFSIGVSRLYSALKLVGKAEESNVLAPVVVTVMDKDRQGDYWRMVQTLRAAGIRAEMYVGASNMGKQMKYADKRGSPLVVIQGGDEKAKGEVMLKDLARGAELASGIESRAEYASQRLAQVSVPEADLVPAVKKMLGLN